MSARTKYFSKTCCVDGCGKNRDGLSGMCGMHRRRKRIYGDVSITKNRKPGEGFFASGYHGVQINGRKQFTHVRVAEAALGKPLPNGAVIHHVDENRANNEPTNLVICPDRAYHNMLHARMRAFAATGNPDDRKCQYCKQYDSIGNLKRTTFGTAHFHSKCVNAYTAARVSRVKMERAAA